MCVQKLVASSDISDVSTAFSGVTLLSKGISPAGVFLDRPDVDNPSNGLLRSATVPPVMPAMSECGCYLVIKLKLTFMRRDGRGASVSWR